MPIEILMPALSPTMTEGTLAKWIKKEGDEIKAGQVIAEIETDKATMEVEAVDEGKLARIIVQDGSQGVKVNKVIALILTEGEDQKAIDNYKIKEEEKPKTEVKEEAKSDAPKADNTATTQTVAIKASVAPDAPIKPEKKGAITSSGERAKASPLAKRVAKDNVIDLSRVVGTGPHGRIVKSDVDAALMAGSAGSSLVRRNKIEAYKVPNNTMRKTIARRLTESKQQVPHFYLTVECEMDALLQLRAQLNDEATNKAGKGVEPAYKLSVNDLIIKACSLALRDKPECNASWYDDAIIQYNNFDISVAVSTDGGLITPIVKNADQKSLPQISKEMKELAGRARKGALKPEEYTGGGFSLSNLGMYGVKHFEAIINPPQASILAVGAAEEKVVRRNGEFVVINVMNATLSVDHRAVDGAMGAEWLQIFKKYIEKPVLMFV